MEFKPGDKVRFLNEKGGGVVVRMINSVMASVAIEDGFEIPTLVANLILIDPQGKSAEIFAKGSESNVKVDIRNQPKLPEQKPAKVEMRAPASESFDPVSKIQPAANSKPVAKGVYMAFVPLRDEDVVLGDLEVFLLNHTDADLLFSIFSKEEDNSYCGFDYGSIPRHSKLLVDTIKREEVGKWSSGIVQLLFHSEQSVRVLAPVSQEFRIKASRFYTEGSFPAFALLYDRKALVYTLCELERLPSTVDQLILEKSQNEPLPVSALQFKVGADIDRHQIAPLEAEVDLHISTLRDDFAELSPHQILQVQIRYFEKMLESAIAFNYRKVVFIHGIGNGTLKQMILGKLHDYELMEVRAASFEKYGNGAIEVLIRNG